MKRAVTRAGFATVALASQIQWAFAATWSNNDSGIFQGKGRVGSDQLRSGDIRFDDVPVLIMNVTQNVLWFAGTVSVLMIIYGAFKLSLGSLESDKDTAKKIITAAIIGFVLSVSGYAIVKIIIMNLAATAAGT